jgi:hypothetical protein
LQDQGVVGLNKKPAPTEIGRAAHHRLTAGAFDHDDLVVLEVRYMLPLHIGSACRVGWACSRLRFARSMLTMVLAVVNDDLQTIPKLLQA